jgi:hypothetical protein
MCRQRLAQQCALRDASDPTRELAHLLTRRQAAAEGFAVDFGKLLTVCYNLASGRYPRAAAPIHGL